MTYLFEKQPKTNKSILPDEINQQHYHNLGHTFSSNLLSSGGNLENVKEMIGHNDLSVTGRYAQLADSHNRRRRNNLAKNSGTNLRCKKIKKSDLT